MPSEKFPEPSREESEQIIDDLHQMARKNISPEQARLVGRVKGINFIETLDFKYRNSINFEMGEAFVDQKIKELITTLFKNEIKISPYDRFYRKIIENEVIKFLKMNILIDPTRIYGQALENEGKIPKGTTDRLYLQSVSRLIANVRSRPVSPELEAYITRYENTKKRFEARGVTPISSN